MGEIGRVQRPDPAINAPNLLGRVLQSGDQRHRHPQERDEPQEDQLELHDEAVEEQPKPQPRASDGEDHHGLDLAV